MSDPYAAIKKAQQLLKVLEKDLTKRLPKEQRAAVKDLFRKTKEEIEQEKARIKREQQEKKDQKRHKQEQSKKATNRADHNRGDRNDPSPRSKGRLSVGKKTATNRKVEGGADKAKKPSRIGRINRSSKVRSYVPARPRLSVRTGPSKKMLELKAQMRHVQLRIRAGMARISLEKNRQRIGRMQARAYKTAARTTVRRESRLRNAYLRRSKVVARAVKRSVLIGDKSRPVIKGQYTALFKASESGIASGAKGALSQGLRPLGPTAYIAFMMGLKAQGKTQEKTTRGSGLVDATGNKTSAKSTGGAGAKESKFFGMVRRERERERGKSRGK